MPQCLSGGDSSNRFKFPFGNLGLKCGNVLPPPVLFPFPSQLSTLMKSYIVVSGGRRKEKEKEKARKGGREKDWEGGS